MFVGVGYSDAPDSYVSGINAVEMAMKNAGRKESCDLILLFCTVRHNQQILQEAVLSVVGQSTRIFGGGAVGIITNDEYGYAGDQVGIACIWLDGVECNIVSETGLQESEQETGARLGQKLLDIGIKPSSPILLFYDAVNHTANSFQLLMATWLLAGLEKGLGFYPNLMGAGMQGDHVCSPTGQFTGDGIGEHCAITLSFSDDIHIESTIMHGCRPASNYYTVTKAEGPVILEINGQPAISFMDKLLGSAITPEEYPFFLLFGINHGDRWGDYDENNYASRMCLGIDKERNGIVMFEPDMIEGTEFRLMFRSLDLDYMKPKIEAMFDRLEDREPIFALYLDCAGRCAGYGGLDMEDALVLQETVNNRVPLLGLYTGVEIAPIGGRPRGLDWTGVFCLFSRSKAGNRHTKTNSSLTGTWETSAKIQNYNKDIDINTISKLCEQNAAKILALDAQSITLRHELEHKRRGFHLLAELNVSLSQSNDYDSIFKLVALKINSALNMQKTIVLVPDNDGLYTPTVLRGYKSEERKRLSLLHLKICPEMLDPKKPVLITAADSEERMADLRKILNLPYFISVPVIPKKTVSAILITGRMKEQAPFLSRLGKNDIETVAAVSAIMASVLVRQKLNETEERAHIMLDSTPLCANFWDKDFNNIDCNQAAVNLFDLSCKKDYLERFPELSPEFQPNGVPSSVMSLEMIKEAFRKGHCSFEWMHQKLNGELIPSKIKLVKVQYKDEDVIVGYTRDLRVLKANMAKIEKTQEELREARDRAEESTKAKSQFLANMSHEIRTPMNAIIGMSEIARSSDNLEHIHHCLNKIEDASNHLLGIINDILDMSQIDSGKYNLSITEFTIDDMLQNIIDVISFKIKEKHHKFTIKVDPDVPHSIITDQMRLNQVITNLLSNAVKFTPDRGNIRLFIHIASDIGDDCVLHIEVADTGIGISEKEQARLFQSFEQADGSISRRFGGTGLGLAISKNIIELMDGQIWVDSELNKGSTFNINVRVKKGTATKSKQKCTDIFTGKHVLLVEDIELNQEILIELLSNTGIKIDTAKNGKIACDMISENRMLYDAILMDIHMPEMDGYETTKAIRYMNIPKDLPIIAMTANVFREDVERCLAAGMNDHIGKPLNMEEVMNKLKHYLL